MGGIRDHVGGGFHRYSVDREWFVPHFEKMLYDQAQIAANYLEAHRLTGGEDLAVVARETMDYMLTGLRSPSGGFFSAEDADSLVSDKGTERREGAYYLWEKKELESLLGDDARLFCEHYDVQDQGNVGPERDAHGEFSGQNILRERGPLAGTAQQLGMTEAEARTRIERAIDRLRKVRLARPRPFLDDKIIAAWNGMAIAVLAKAARLLGAPDYLEAAMGAACFVRKALYDESRGVLRRSIRDGRAGGEGFAEDYACVVEGLVELYEATFDTQWLEWAVRLQGRMDDLFWDDECGGYHGSAKHDPGIILRMKDEHDGAEPSAGSVAAMNLVRLAPVSCAGDVYLERARRIVQSLQPVWGRQALALPRMLCVLDMLSGEQGTIVVTGEPDSAGFNNLLETIVRAPGPRRAVLAGRTGADWAWLSSRAEWLAAMNGAQGPSKAYYCGHYTCSAPVATASELAVLLGAPPVGRGGSAALGDL